MQTTLDSSCTFSTNQCSCCSKQVCSGLAATADAHVRCGVEREAGVVLELADKPGGTLIEQVPSEHGTS